MQSTLPLDDLIALGRNRWSISLLADLAAHAGARFVELHHRLDLPRDSLVRTLAHAAAAGWVVRNPGYGHPLRPEYVLTKRGASVAKAAAAIASVQARLDLSPGQLTRWSIPVVRLIGPGHARFSELNRRLPAATPRAISQSLQSLTGHNLVLREVTDDWPPASNYRLTSSGLQLARAC